MIGRPNRKLYLILLAILFASLLAGCRQTIDARQLEKINGLFYKINANDPFTGTTLNNIRFFGNTSTSSSNCTIEYKNGQMNGSSICYSLNDNIKVYEVNYKNNRKHGTQTQWDDKKFGSVMWKIDWKNDLKDGAEEHYNLENGKLIQQTHWKEGRKVGEEKEWDRNGNVLLQNFDWQNGKQTGFIKAGDIEANYKDGELHGIKREYSLNGQEQDYKNACPSTIGLTQRIGLCSYTMYDHSIELEEMYENGKLMSRKIKGEEVPFDDPETTDFN